MDALEHRALMCYDRQCLQQRQISIQRHSQPTYVHFIADHYRGSTHAHTHSHASLMKTTFVLSCFVLLHNKKILLAQSTFAHRVQRNTHFASNSPEETPCRDILSTLFLSLSRGWKSVFGELSNTHSVCQFANVISVCPCSVSFNVLLNSFPKCHKTTGTSLLFQERGEQSQRGGECLCHGDVHVPRVGCVPCSGRNTSVKRSGVWTALCALFWRNVSTQEPKAPTVLGGSSGFRFLKDAYMLGLST